MQCPCEKFDILKYKNKPYLLTPCASCFMTKLTTNTNKHSILYDTDGALLLLLTELKQEELDLSEMPSYFEESSDNELTPEAINLVVLACLRNFLLVLSNVVLKLTDLARLYPVTYQILHMKMQYPSMSYSLIGRNLNPPCSKQNVLYHLSNAVKQFPDLCASIITDTRFSGGRYAIKNIAGALKKDRQIERVRKLLYASTEANKRLLIEELKKEFDKPVSNIPIEFFDAYKDLSKSQLKE